MSELKEIVEDVVSADVLNVSDKLVKIMVKDIRDPFLFIDRMEIGELLERGVVISGFKVEDGTVVVWFREIELEEKEVEVTKIVEKTVGKFV